MKDQEGTKLEALRCEVARWKEAAEAAIAEATSLRASIARVKAIWANPGSRSAGLHDALEALCGSHVPKAVKVDHERGYDRAMMHMRDELARQLSEQIIQHSTFRLEDLKVTVHRKATTSPHDVSVTVGLVPFMAHLCGHTPLDALKGWEDASRVELRIPLRFKAGDGVSLQRDGRSYDGTVVYTARDLVVCDLEHDNGARWQEGVRPEQLALR